MKVYLFVVALAVLSACGKKNDANLLRNEAVTLARYYEKKLEVLDQRVLRIFDRGKEIPGNLPGIDEIGRRLQEARDTIIRLRELVTPGPDQKSAVEKQADAAVKDNRRVDLEKLVHDTEVQLDRGVTVINANLDTVEAWIAQYDSKTLAMAPPPEEPGMPETQSTPATGEPPAAVEPQVEPKAPKAPRPPAKAGAQPKQPAPEAPAQNP